MRRPKEEAKRWFLQAEDDFRFVEWVPEIASPQRHGVNRGIVSRIKKNRSRYGRMPSIEKANAFVLSIGCISTFQSVRIGSPRCGIS